MSNSEACSGRTALVTGGTSGVGLSLVRELAGRGYSVHFIGSNADKGAAVMAELGETGRCTFIRLDLSDLRGVQAFARAFGEEVPRLDLLLNVAGVVVPRRRQTPDGLEKTLAIGYLSHYILCRELTESLASAEGARIANVAGSPAQVVKQQLDFDNLGLTTGYNPVRAAIRAVHAKVVLTQILAEQLRDRGIDVNAFHPGAVKSDLGQHMPGPLAALFKVARVFMASTSRSGVHVATSDEVRGITGQLFVGTKATPLRFDKAYRDALVAATERLLGPVLSA